MTYKEYAKLHWSEYVGEQFKGGIFGCPYRFGLEFNTGLCHDQEGNINATDETCTACWNQEMEGETNV